MSLYPQKRPTEPNPTVERLIHSIVHSEDILAFPLMGTETDTGTDGGGVGGGITSILGGVGITILPDPIIPAGGTVELDIQSLGTLATALQGTDWLALVDGDAGGSQIANQRKVSVTTLQAGLQPLDADLTAYAALATTGLVVRTGAGTVVTRQIDVVDTATVNLTITNATGVGGNPTLQADVLGGGGGGITSLAGGVGITNTPEPVVPGVGTVDLDIDSLTTLVGALAGADLFALVDASGGGTPIANQRKVSLTGLADGIGSLDLLDEYTRIAGRVGTANDTTLTTSVGGTGALYGGSDPGAFLKLAASSSGAAHTGRIRTYDELFLRTDVIGTTLSAAVDVMGVTTFPGPGGTLTLAHTNATAAVVGMVGTINCAAALVGGAGFANNQWRYLINTAGGRFPGASVLGNFPVFEVSGVSVGAGSVTPACVVHKPRFVVSAGGSIVALADKTIDEQYILDSTAVGTSISNFAKYGYHIQAPLMLGGAFFQDFWGYRVEDFPTGNENFSYMSLGTSHKFLHGGYMRVGSNSTAGAGTDVIATFHGHLSLTTTASGASPEFRLRDATSSFALGLRAGAGMTVSNTYDLPTAYPAVSGYLLACTTGGVMSWTAPAAGGGPTIVTDPVTGSATVIPNGSDQTLNTVAATPGAGTDVNIIGSVHWTKSSAANKEVVLKLFKDGTEINTADRYNHFNTAGGANQSVTQTAHWAIASETAGPHTYTLRATETQGGAPTANRITSRLTVVY